MANTIQGKNVVLFMLDSAVYYPVFCAQDGEFVLDQDEIETTSINSGSDREYVAGMSSKLCNLNGITTIDNTNSRISIFYLMQLSIRRVLQSFKLVMTADDATVLNITFTGLIKTTTFNRARGSYSKSSVVLRVSGPITFSSSVTPPASTTIYEKYLTLADGSLSVSHADLDGITEVLIVEREGVQYDETTGTPGNRQVRYTDGVGTGTLDFLLPGNPGGESVHIVFRR